MTAVPLSCHLPVPRTMADPSAMTRSRPVSTITHVPAHDDRTEDDVRIRQVVADVADAWHRHDPTAALDAFADDLDHLRVRGRWPHSRAEREQTFRDDHASSWREVTFHADVETIRFRRPDVAVAIVGGGLRTAGGMDEARATWVLSKQDDMWRGRAGQQTYVQDIPNRPLAS
jgi:uncharacterized protein (TIGR02246 family)